VELSCDDGSILTVGLMLSFVVWCVVARDGLPGWVLVPVLLLSFDGTV
jgi:hypothetical protein